jgi:hypothetical protein
MGTKYTAELNRDQASILAHQFFMSPDLSSTVSFSSVPEPDLPLMAVTLEAIDDGTTLEQSIKHGQLRSWGWHKFFKRQ